MIVSDSCNHRVVILDQAGTWLLTIIGNVLGNHHFLYPYGVALDPQGNIHVAASGSNTIKVFTPEGTYVRSNGDVKGRTGIVIDEEGYSLVTEYSGRCLSIFDSQGYKVHTVGNLNGPHGVMLHVHTYIHTYIHNNIPSQLDAYMSYTHAIQSRLGRRNSGGHKNSCNLHARHQNNTIYYAVQNLGFICSVEPR